MAPHARFLRAFTSKKHIVLIPKLKAQISLMHFGLLSPNFEAFYKMLYICIKANHRYFKTASIENRLKLSNEIVTQ